MANAQKINLSMTFPTNSLEALEAALADDSLPPVHLWQPEISRSIDMRIARNGDWYYQGSVISRKRMVRLFSSVLRLDDDGHHYLVTPQEKCRIVVEDAPFTAVLLHTEGKGKEQKLIFTTNTGDNVIAGTDHAITIKYIRPDGEPSPYVHVRDGLNALLSRSVYIELAERLVLADSQISDTDNTEQFGVYSDGVFFPLAFN